MLKINLDYENKFSINYIELKLVNLLYRNQFIDYFYETIYKDQFSDYIKINLVIIYENQFNDHII